jgi:hypothetical protein
MNALRNIASAIWLKPAITTAAATGIVSRLQPQQPPHHYLQQTVVRLFASKYISKSAKKRLPMTTKRAGKGYYKGNGSTKEGHINSKGKFIIDPKRRLELMVPDLTSFTVRRLLE